MMCLATTINSESAGESSESGGRPDFESSPEVLTCSRTLRGEESRSAGRALFTASAALIEDRVWIVCRFGIAENGSAILIWADIVHSGERTGKNL